VIEPDNTVIASHLAGVTLDTFSGLIAGRAEKPASRSSTQKSCVMLEADLCRYALFRLWLRS